MTCVSNGKEQAPIPCMSLGRTCKMPVIASQCGRWLHGFNLSNPTKSFHGAPKLHKQRSHFPPKRV